MSIEAARLHARVDADTGPAERELRGFGGRAQRTLAGSMTTAGQHAGRALMGGLAGALVAGAGVYAIGRTLAGVVGQGMQIYTQQERLKQQLRSMSAMELVDAGMAENFSEGLAVAGERAEELYGWVRKLAIQSPYSASDIAPMLRLGMVYGFNSDQAQRLTEATMNYGTAIGLTGPDMERVVRALGQMQTRGKVTSQELMQLSEVGVAGLSILAEAAGVTEAEMQKMVEQGIVAAGPAIELITKDFETYAGAAEASAGTLGGLLSSIQDLKEYALTDFMSAPLEGIKEPIQALVTLLSSDQTKEAIQGLGESLAGLMETPLDSFTTKMERLIDVLNPQTISKTSEAITKVGQGPLGPQGGLVPGNPDQARVQADKWSEVIGIITGWDAKGVMRTLDILFPNREGAQARRFAVDFKELTNFQQFIDGLNRGNDAGDIGNALFGTLFNFDMVQAQADFNAQQAEFWGKFDWHAKLQEWIKRPFDEAMGQLFGGLWSGLSEGAQGYGTAIRLLFEGTTWTPVVDWATPLVWGLTQKAGVVGEWFAVNIWQPAVDWYNPLIDGLVEAKGAVLAWLDANVVQWVVKILPEWLYDPSESTGAGGVGNTHNFPRGITPPLQSPIDPLPYGPGYALGTESALQGWAWVGEQGPELMYVPGDATIVDNKRSKRLWRMMKNLPGFAEGTGPQPWIPGQTSTFGDPAALLGAAAKETTAAAKEQKAAAKAMEQAADNLGGLLGGVPGLFGASPVTAEQMEMAELGVPQNFADDYLRRLTDEVMNGVDWAGVDLEDAATRAGIDPSLPAEAILKLFSQAWNDSSLFSNPANLDLINTDAVMQGMQRQQDSAAGEANIKALFGLGDDALVESIAGLGLEVQNGISQWLTENGMPEAGATIAAALGSGVQTNNSALGDGVGGGLTTWTTSAEGQAVLTDVGQRMADIISSAMKIRPDVDLPPMPPVGAPPPGSLPLPDTGARSGGVSATGGRAPGTVVIENATISDRLDVELLAQRVAKLMKQGRVMV